MDKRFLESPQCEFSEGHNQAPETCCFQVDHEFCPAGINEVSEKSEAIDIQKVLETHNLKDESLASNASGNHSVQLHFSTEKTSSMKLEAKMTDNLTSPFLTCASDVSDKQTDNILEASQQKSEGHDALGSIDWNDSTSERSAHDKLKVDITNPPVRRDSTSESSEDCIFSYSFTFERLSLSCSSRVSFFPDVTDSIHEIMPEIKCEDRTSAPDYEMESSTVLNHDNDFVTKRCDIVINEKCKNSSDNCIDDTVTISTAGTDNELITSCSMQANEDSTCISDNNSCDKDLIHMTETGNIYEYNFVTVRKRSRNCIQNHEIQNTEVEITTTLGNENCKYAATTINGEHSIVKKENATEDSGTTKTQFQEQQYSSSDISEYRKECFDMTLNRLPPMKENNEVESTVMRPQFQEQDFPSHIPIAENMNNEGGQMNFGMMSSVIESGSETVEKLFCMNNNTMDIDSSSVQMETISAHSLNISPKQMIPKPHAAKIHRRHTFQPLDFLPETFNCKNSDENREVKENIPVKKFDDICQKRETLPRSCVYTDINDNSSNEHLCELIRQYNAWQKVLFPEKSKKYSLRSQMKVLKEVNSSSKTSSIALEPKSSKRHSICGNNVTNIVSDTKSKRRRSDHYFLRPLKISQDGNVQNNASPRKAPLTEVNENRKKSSQRDQESKKFPINKACARTAKSGMPPTPPQKKFTHCKDRVPLYKFKKFPSVVSPIKKDLTENPPPPLIQTVVPKKPLKINSTKTDSLVFENINEEQSDLNAEQSIDLSPVLPPAYVLKKPDLSTINDRDWSRLTRFHTVENKKKKTLYFPSIYKPSISRHKTAAKVLHWAECLTSDKSLNSSPSNVSKVAKPILVKHEMCCPLTSFSLDADIRDISITEQVSVQYSNTLSSM